MRLYWNIKNARAYRVGPLQYHRHIITGLIKDLEIATKEEPDEDSR